ncbi:MAG: hypothetical protein ACFUZC_20840 [Chthoniobacteraceae bacterium]
MKRTPLHTVSVWAATLLLASSVLIRAGEPPTKPFIQEAEGWRSLEQAGHLSANNAQIRFDAGRPVLEAAANTTAQLELTSPEGFFDAEGFTRLVAELQNEGSTEVKYELRLDNEGATDTSKTAYYFGWITPGQTKKAIALFPYKKEDLNSFPDLKVFLPMKGLPGGMLFEEHNINPGKIQKIKLTFFPAGRTVKIALGTVYASHPPVPALLAKNNFFPFIDAYGQFIHDTWPGKVTLDEDLKAATREEEQDLAQNPGPENRSKYGGWTKGPKLEATGFFRAEKYNGKWWLADPEGYLFWSSGPTCVGFGGADTTLKNREYFFSGLPEADSPLARYYAKDGTVFMYTQANLHRKYGSDWETQFAETTQRRLKSWGMNTLANWSNPRMTAMRRSPYVIAVDFKCDTVTWRHFPDVFSPTFRKNLRAAFQTRAETFNDPWCIGYFVQNELKFGGPQKFMEDVCMDPATSPCKVEWVKDLERNLHGISKFNSLAGTHFTSWNALLANTSAIKLDQLSSEAEAFYKKMCTAYFSICKEEQKRVAPHQLYLGCRFLQNVSAVPVTIAAQFCDVVSYNIYEYSVVSRTVAKIDKPFIIGEFHFGALDRGMFGPGCRWAGDQQDRAGLYRDYVTGALQNPYCVGAHWFQYNSQAFTGRDPDGENYQVGLLDITGNPYPELREAIRKTSYGIYETRMSAPTNASN